MPARIGKTGVFWACIFVCIFCVGPVLGEEKAAPPPVDPNLNFEVKELTIPVGVVSRDVRQNTPAPYKVFLRFKQEQRELWVQNSPDGRKIFENISEKTNNFPGSRSYGFVGNEKNEDNTYTITLRAATEEDAKIMAANMLRLIQERRNSNLTQVQDSIARMKSQIEKFPDEIKSAKEEKQQLDKKIEAGKNADWAVMSDAELQGFILELKKAALMVNCEIAGAEKKYDVLKQKGINEHTSDPLTPHLIAANAELEGFKAKKQATMDLLNAIEQFLFNKNRAESLEKDIPAKENQLKELPEWLKQREKELAEMKPIELTDDVVQIEHYQIAQQ